MKNAACPESLPALHSGRPGEALSEIRLGFAAEPVVDLARVDGPVLYDECLARMLICETVLLKGGEFVPGFEESGNIGLLDAAVLRLVLDALADDPHAVLGCNISPKTLADAGAWDEVMRPIARRPSLASRLVLEVTESAPLTEIANLTERLAEAKQAGCRLAIDDLGAGFATPEHLLDVGVAWDIVKIDRSCLAGTTVDPPARLAEMVRLAGAITENVVVEGIELEEHLAAARAAGAGYGQGWLFARTVPERWETVRPQVGQRLAATLFDHGALMRRAPLDRASMPGGRDLLLSRIDGPGACARALIARAKARGPAE